MTPISMPDLSPLGNGALTGALIGTQAGQSIDSMQAANIANQLQNQQDQYKFDQLKKDADMTEAERKYKTALAGAQTDDITSGAYKARIASGDQSKSLANEAAGLTNKETKMLQMGQAAYAVDQNLGDPGSAPPHVMDFARRAMKNAGFPDLPDNDQEALDYIKDHSQWYQNNAATLKLKQENAAKLDQIKAMGENSAYTADTRYDAMTEVARIKAENAALAAGSKQGIDAKLVQLSGKGDLTSLEAQQFTFLTRLQQARAQAQVGQKMDQITNPGALNPQSAVTQSTNAITAGAGAPPAPQMPAATPPPAPQAGPQDAQAAALLGPLTKAGVMATFVGGKLVGANGGPVKLDNPRMQYALIPPGTVFVGPDGVPRRKP